MKIILACGVPALLGLWLAIWTADRDDAMWIAYATAPLAVLPPLVLAVGATRGERVDRTPAKPQAAAAPAEKPAPPPPPAPKRPEGEDALVLLATLQREARLIDFLKEDLSGYEDAQVGAAVRDVHRDAAAVLERLFAPAPAVEAEEGSRLDPASLPAGRVKTTGQVGGGSGTLVHPGWAATKVNLPARTGPPDEAAVRVLAPAEVEVG